MIIWIKKERTGNDDPCWATVEPTKMLQAHADPKVDTTTHIWNCADIRQATELSRVIRGAAIIRRLTTILVQTGKKRQHRWNPTLKTPRRYDAQVYAGGKSRHDQRPRQYNTNLYYNAKIAISRTISVELDPVIRTASQHHWHCHTALCVFL